MTADAWDDLTAWEQAMVLAYDQVSSYDANERDIAMAGGKSRKASGRGQKRASEPRRSTSRKT